MQNFLTMNQLSNQDVYSIMELAEEMRYGNHEQHKKLFAANLFFEPSTRTKMSFITAQRKLGFEVLDFHHESSSVLKGETLYDTAKTFEAIGANMLIIRHMDDTWYDDLVNSMQIPIINAGSGKGEHPTQCMLDLTTIYQEFGCFQGLNVVISGDIKHSRVARSNAYALQQLGANVYLSAAPGFEDDSLDLPYAAMDEAVRIADVVMLLRIQHERHTKARFQTDKGYLEQYGLTKEREQCMRKNAIIMHPAPINREMEIDSSLVECKRSRIFKQMENGVYVRMAIMTKLFQEWGIINDSIKKCNKTSA